MRKLNSRKTMYFQPSAVETAQIQDNRSQDHSSRSPFHEKKKERERERKYTATLLAKEKVPNYLKAAF